MMYEHLVPLGSLELAELRARRDRVLTWITIVGVLSVCVGLAL